MLSIFMDRMWQSINIQGIPKLSHFPLVGDSWGYYKTTVLKENVTVLSLLPHSIMLNSSMNRAVMVSMAIPHKVMGAIMELSENNNIPLWENVPVII